MRRSEIVRNSPPDISLLVPPEKKWKPAVLLGVDFSEHDWQDGLQIIRAEASLLSDDLLVAVFYNGTTEGALPSYLARQQQFDAIRDFTGTDMTPWGIWERGWTSEEHDHDEYHRDYLRFSGRVRMHYFDTATGNLIRRGFNINVKDPLGLVLYGIWQELNTAAAHDNTADLALAQGATVLARGLKHVRSDERRHAEAYMRSADKILGASPSDVVTALYELLSSEPEMPGKNVDGFDLYEKVVFWNNVFTPQTVVSTEEKMMERLKVGTLHGLSSEAEEAREKLLALEAERGKRAGILEGLRLRGRKTKLNLSPFDWLVTSEAA